MNAVLPHPGNREEEQRGAYRTSLAARAVSAADADTIAVRTSPQAVPLSARPIVGTADSPPASAKPFLPSKAGSPHRSQHCYRPRCTGRQ